MAQGDLKVSFECSAELLKILDDFADARKKYRGYIIRSAIRNIVVGDLFSCDTTIPGRFPWKKQRG